MGSTVDGRPQRAELIRRQQLLDTLGRRPAQRRADRPREPAEVVREGVLEFTGYVECLVQLVDDEDRKRFLDLFLQDQLFAELDPRFGVQRLYPHPRRQRRDDGEDGRNRDQCRRESRRLRADDFASLASVMSVVSFTSCFS